MNANKIGKNEEIELLEILKNRFSKNLKRHPKTQWNEVEKRIKNNPQKLYSIYLMEKSGGEPDIVEFPSSETLYFVDCVTESPKNRRSFCYDKEALDSRKENKPQNSAINVAKEMGIEILNEKQYRELQTIEILDLKTSSWIFTPENIRNLGGALFCDRRYDAVFTYHNGASSYYASRGFRGILEI